MTIFSTNEPWKNAIQDSFAVEAAIFLLAGLGDNDAILTPWNSTTPKGARKERDARVEDRRRASNSPKDRNGIDPNTIITKR